MLVAWILENELLSRNVCYIARELRAEREPSASMQMW
jgi:hypothetical protein